MCLKRKLSVILICGIIFISQLGMAAALVKVDSSHDSTDDIMSTLHDIPVTTFSNPKPTPE